MKKKWIISLFLCLSFRALFSSSIEPNLQSVLSAERYIKQQNPSPHFIAYHKNDIIGICFLSTDILPSKGYNGPITILIGLNKTGYLSGISIIDHKENIAIADEIREESFINQFKNKNLNDPFKVSQDIQGITGATITVKRLSEIVKKSGKVMYHQCFTNMSRDNQELYSKTTTDKLWILLLSIFLLSSMGLFLLRWYQTKRQQYLLISVLLGAIFIIIVLIYGLKDKKKQSYDDKIIYKHPVSFTKENNISFTNKDLEKKEENIILTPKWSIKQVDKGTIEKQIKSGNLSDKEAVDYQTLEE